MSKKKDENKVACSNKKAYHLYFIDETIEAGMVLVGTEVKSLRNGQGSLTDAYARIKNGEVFLYQAHIGQYSHSHHINHEPLRVRKLLLHNREIKRLIGKIQNKGVTLVPTSIYFVNGRAKVALGLARGKRKYDKRQAIKKRDLDRDMEQYKKKYK